MDDKSRYNHKEIEEKWLFRWEKEGFGGADVNPSKKPYTISMPPPNVTDILHLGHALNNTIQDIYIRWKRMKGFEALWVPGVDHASIATEVVVEANLPSGKTKEDIGRERFLELLWDWTEAKKNYILDQLKRIGCSADFSKTKFTLDPDLSSAVGEAFIKLHKAGLIYRGDYVVNWCPRCQTALSNEEVEYEEVDGNLYYIKYPTKKEKGKRIKDKGQTAGIEFLVVATTRPETMLGDTAIAVHPDDERYEKYLGSDVILPLMNRKIPVVADLLVNPEFGTGVVKVTPAHDANDFEIGKRKNLKSLVIMDKKGRINENGGRYKGLSRETARERILDDLRRDNLLEEVKPYKHSVGHCYRCKTAIEPYLSRQWFVRMKKLAEPAIEAVEKGEVKFYPKRWENVYLSWMRNIRDWCISRQLWWGHPIPVWYCQEMQNAKCKMQNGVIVAREKPERCPECGGTDIVQDPDVLDTWFSSWLWPFSTLGWPEKSPLFRYFYPTELLVTGPEIIFFWVARMIMGGYFFTDSPPFRDVYIHGTVRDNLGRKMSKSLGNGIDPLKIIDQYGTDALRFSILAVAGEGQDPHIEERTFELGRNFANKLWNARRLLQILGSDKKYDPDLADKWISSRLSGVIEGIETAFSNYRLHEALMLIHNFFWHEYCDFYLEIIKKTGHIDYGWRIFTDILHLLHPFIPFITEELNPEDTPIIVSKYPVSGEIDLEIEKTFGEAIEIITDIRDAKRAFNIPAKKEIPVYIRYEKLGRVKPYITSLAHLGEYIPSKPDKGIRRASHNYEVVIPLVGVLNLHKENARLEKEVLRLKKLLDKTRKSLSNTDFLNKASPSVVENMRRKEREIGKKLEVLSADLRVVSSE
ncbi:valine--tRNA ligase [candidate division WOR-3 bacterium]|nr:valine--tRNA ligase [candidate division WOR-3 bacterium]